MNRSGVIEFPGETRRSQRESGAGCLDCGGTLQSSITGLCDTRFGVEENYEVRCCNACGLKQIFPVPESTKLQRLYETHYNFGGEKETSYTRMRDSFLASFWYRVWLQLDGDASFHSRKGTGRLLDIGCNEGRSMKIFARNGFHVTGLELNEQAASVARFSGFTVKTCKLAEYEPAALYDVVVLSNVLEHSPAPRQMLQDAARVLKAGGEVWISCPNSKSWQRFFFGRAWINWHVPFHISHFSAGLLDRWFDSAGCYRVTSRQVSPAAWLASSLLVSAFFRRGKPTRQLRSAILFPLTMALGKLLLFPFLCVANRFGRGDCLVVVAKKI
jgi:2-polyprenyl-3-methyl-5-hydroxy-6-metoxy-1,4-benzoquinol methylase